MSSSSYIIQPVVMDLDYFSSGSSALSLTFLRMQYLLKLFKNTIAHGYLTVSVMPYLWEQIAEFKNVKMQVNYGIEKLKFNQAVLVDSEIRMKATLADLKNLRGVTKATLNIVIEIKDNKKPALETDIIFLYHFH